MRSLLFPRLNLVLSALPLARAIAYKKRTSAQRVLLGVKIQGGLNLKHTSMAVSNATGLPERQQVHCPPPRPQLDHTLSDFSWNVCRSGSLYAGDMLLCIITIANSVPRSSRMCLGAVFFWTSHHSQQRSIHKDTPVLCLCQPKTHCARCEQVCTSSCSQTMCAMSNPQCHPSPYSASYHVPAPPTSPQPPATQIHISR